MLLLYAFEVKRTAAYLTFKDAKSKSKVHSDIIIIIIHYFYIKFLKKKKNTYCTKSHDCDVVPF